MKSELSAETVDKILDMALSWELDARVIAQELDLKTAEVKKVLWEWNNGFYKTR